VLPLVAALTVAATRIAIADPGAEAHPPGPHVKASADAKTSDRTADVDVGDGQIWLAPTAKIAPAGSWTFSANQVVILGVAHAPLDWLELSVQAFPGYLYRGAVKARVLRVERLHAAVAADIARAEGNSLGGLGGIVTLCIDDDCRSLANATAMATYATYGPAADGARLVGMLALLARITDNVKATLEVDVGLAELEPLEDDSSYPVAAWYGLRLHRGDFSADVGMAVGIDFFFGAPWIKVSYRP
jgi:hypothetical protein